MADQKNPMDAGHTSRNEQNDKKNKTQNPQDSERVGGDAARTKATGKPEDKNTEQPGRSSKPDVKAQK